MQLGRTCFRGATHVNGPVFAGGGHQLRVPVKLDLTKGFVLSCSELPAIKLRWSPNNDLILGISPENGGTLVTVFSSSMANSMSHFLADHDLTAEPLDITWINETDFILCGRLRRNMSSLLIPYLISGPPGTGKTKTIIETAMQLIKNVSDVHHILICAPSEPAADTLAHRLMQYMSKDGSCF